MGKFVETFGWIALGLIPTHIVVSHVLLPPPEPIVKYIYDDEARLVGFCNGKYLIRTEEDEFPKAGCMFIEPITWEERP